MVIFLNIVLRKYSAPGMGDRYIACAAAIYLCPECISGWLYLGFYRGRFLRWFYFFLQPILK